MNWETAEATGFRAVRARGAQRHPDQGHEHSSVGRGVVGSVQEPAHLALAVSIWPGLPETGDGNGTQPRPQTVYTVCLEDHTVLVTDETQEP